jgi:universal stress protein E
MRPIRRILVAIKDPTAKSLSEVTKASQLAKALGAQLELFHAIAAPLYFDAYTALDGGVKKIERSTRERYLEQLEAIAVRERRHGIKVSVCAEWDYPVYEAVLRRASRMKADLIVAERHAGRHLAAGLLKLTDWELLRLSPIPVLLVKTEGPYRKPVVLAAVDPNHSYSKPAKLDQEILQAGSTVAEALHGSLHAVHAYMPIPAASVADGTAYGDALAQVEAEAAQKAEEGLDRVLRSSKIPDKRRHLVGRHAIDAIEQTARQTHSAIVVMGAVSRSGIRRLVIGNTAESVLDHLACDLLIVKPAHFTAKRVPRGRRGVHLVSTGVAPIF